MDFFTTQDRSRRSTRYLLLLFAIAFTIVALVSAAAVTAIVAAYGQDNVVTAVNGDWPGLVAHNAPLLAGIAAATLGLMVVASGFRAATLAGGGGQVARMLGGTEIAGGDGDPLHERLVNVVEEMAIASGLPVPEIHVLEQEAGINAFAAGLTHGDAAIAVTRGALEQLTRAELQGVVAHEFSHILNGDMRLNQRLIGFSFGILVLYIVGRWLLRSSRFALRSRNRGLSIAIVAGMVLAAVGGLGVFLTRLIKAAVSRQRETLADASAVQFTREPSALAGALKKIGGYTARLDSIGSEEVSHMLFGSSSSRFTRWLATHPPLAERIRALDPTFRADDYPAPRPPGSLPDAGGGAPASAFAAADDSALLDRAGRIESAELGGALRRAIPEPLYAAAHQRDTSLLLVAALAISQHAAEAARQQRLIEQRLGTTRARHCMTLRAQLDALEPALRLPLVELALPALRQRPPEQLEFVIDLITELAAIDPAPRLFDHLLLRLLGTYFPATARRRQTSADAARPGIDAAIAALFNCVAAHGHSTPDAAAAAAAAGWRALGVARDAQPEAFAELDALRDPARLDAPLARVAELPAHRKRSVLAALLALIRHDRRLATAEIELFRVIAAVLGCPLPPTALDADASGTMARPAADATTS